MSYTKEYFDATDITSSSFVFASAGSGKTKILVDRYIKSLFFGIKPEEILCITFTNAAVFEMEIRISNILEKLYINENGFTHKYISETFKINPTIDNIKKAESLFFLFQENLSNLKILTIHSFCQKLLQQFPLEADISPNFEIIEERDSLKFLQDTKEQVLRDLNEETVQKLSDYFSIYSLESFVNKIQQYIPNFLELFEDFSDIYEYKKYLNLKFDHSKNNIEFTEEQKYFINENFKDEDLENLYLTSAGDIRKKIPFPNNRTSQVLAEIIFKNSQNEKKKQVIEKTCIFLELVNQIIQKYEKFKSDNNVLDFSDVLFKTKYLLTKSCAKEFALSRICNKIKSIMIDEAQDLSKIQWELIHLFSEDIYTDPSSDKTIFIVGDIKQSIYRFQGADYSLFSKFYQFCSNALKNLNKKFKTIYLNINYRTISKILNVVDKVFIGEIAEFSMNNGIVDYKKHIPFYENAIGDFSIIELNEDECDNQFIAQKILQLKTENSLILTRSRSELSENIINKLIDYGVKIAPSDRFNLKDNFLILDIIAIAEICINPEYNYALCCFLKSPYFFKTPFSNDDFFKLCYNRMKSVFENLEFYDLDKYNYIKKIIEHYKEDNLREFFCYIINLVENLNQDDEDAVTAFIDEINKFSEKHSDNIPEFLKYFKETDIQVINQNISKDCIRLSTIHGSKGLEADTVFLLDFSLSADKQKTNFVFSFDNEFLRKNYQNSMFFIKPSQKDSFLELSCFIEKEYKEEEKELLRLLYVAMTRARKNLYIFGKGNGNTAFNLIKSKYIN